MVTSVDAQVTNAVPVVEHNQEEAGGGGGPSGGGGGGGRAASGRGEDGERERVRKLKENCRRALWGTLVRSETRWRSVQSHAWFEEVVAALRADPCLTHSPRVLLWENVPRPLGRGVWDLSNLHVAVLLGDLEMVQRVLGTGPIVPRGHDIDTRCGWGVSSSLSSLGLAVVCVESDIVDALLNQGAQPTGMGEGYLQEGVVQAAACHCARSEEAATEKLIRIMDALVLRGFNINSKDIGGRGWTVFYVAVATGNTALVKKLLEWKDKIQLNEACRGGPPPIQIANKSGFKDMENALMQCEDVRRYVESAFRDRQAYVDAANAILVGAALIASVTFASWLQPPLGYTTPYGGGSSAVAYVDVEHNAALGSFWVFNTLSFYFAMGTVVFGAHSVLPRRHLFITENVKKLSQNLFLTSVLLAFSVFFVTVAFGIAGFIVLVPILRYRWYMVAPTIFGGIVCVGSIGYLFKSLWENSPRSKKKNEEASRIATKIRSEYGYAVGRED